MLTPKIKETENLFRPKRQRLSMLKTSPGFESQIFCGTLMQGRVLELNTECDVEPDWVRISQTIGSPRQTTPTFVFALLPHLHVRKSPQGRKKACRVLYPGARAHTHVEASSLGETTDIVR